MSLSVTSSLPSAGAAACPKAAAESNEGLRPLPFWVATRGSSSSSSSSSSVGRSRFLGALSRDRRRWLCASLSEKSVEPPSALRRNPLISSMVALSGSCRSSPSSAAAESAPPPARCGAAAEDERAARSHNGCMLRRCTAGVCCAEGGGGGARRFGSRRRGAAAGRSARLVVVAAEETLRALVRHRAGRSCPLWFIIHGTHTNTNRLLAQTLSARGRRESRSARSRLAIANDVA